MYPRILCISFLCFVLSVCWGRQVDLTNGGQYPLVTLTELFRIGDESGSDSVYFGSIWAIAVNSAGQIFVADNQAPSVLVFSDAGQLLERIGSRGEGPGEFSEVERVTVGARDTVFVWDGEMDRVSVFSPEGYDFVRSVRIQRTNDGLAPTTLLGVVNSNYVFVYSRPFGFTAAGIYERPDSMSVALVGEDGHVVGQLVSVPADADIHATFIPSGGIAIREIPFGWESFIRLGPNNHVYSGHNGSINIAVTNLSGHLEGSVSRSHQPALVTRADIETELAGIKFDSNRERQELVDAVPRSKPAYETFRVDDSGRVWLKTLNDRDLSAIWSILLGTGAVAGRAVLPAHVNLRVIKSDKAYAIGRDNTGADIIIVYEIKMLNIR